MALPELESVKQSLDDTLVGGGGNNPTFFESAVGPGLGVAGGEVEPEEEEGLHVFRLLVGGSFVAGSAVAKWESTEPLPGAFLSVRVCRASGRSFAFFFLFF
jgi:hypothetical protein